MFVIGTSGKETISSRINHALRVRANNSARLSRTFGTPSSTTTLTYSLWIKRGSLSQEAIFSGTSSDTTANVSLCQFRSDNTLNFFTQSGGAVISDIVTTSVFRDPSAFMHVVIRIDTTQATAANRIRIYVNGRQQTTTGTQPALNSGTHILNGCPNYLGRYVAATPLYADGYRSRIVAVDGQSLGPEAFGQNDTNGVWVSKDFASVKSVADNGGVNSFHLDFEDGSSLSALGQDSSSKGNNWTLTNISLTAGITYDWVTDTPSNNFCTLTPLDVFPTEQSGIGVLSEGNLRITGGNQFARGWTLPEIGDFYWEVTLLDPYTSGNSWWGAYGISSNGFANLTGIYATTNASGAYGGIWVDGAASQLFTTWANNDVVGLHYAASTRTLTVFRNGVQRGTSVVAGSGTKYIYAFCNGTADTSSAALNFGQRPFIYTPPVGSKRLCTDDLAAVVIPNPKQHSGAKLYLGNGLADNEIPVESTPEFLWLKSLSTANSHTLADIVRGEGSNGYLTLQSNTNNAELDGGNITAIGESSFTLGSNAGTNGNGNSLVAWHWKADGEPVANTNGSISSLVSANVDAGFSIVSYVGSGANATVGHGLLDVPSVIFFKGTSAADSWFVYHSSMISALYYMQLQATNAQTNNATVFNSTAPTSSVFSIGTNTDINGLGKSYVAYCYSPVRGYSSSGLINGNGSANGPLIRCEFSPNFIMIKRINAAGHWRMFDRARDPINEAGHILNANGIEAESVAAGFKLDFLANGFKLRGTAADLNASGGQYAYLAFAENPFGGANVSPALAH